MKKIKILFIDPALLFRKGFALYLNGMDNIEVVHEVSSMDELTDQQLKAVNLILFDTVTDSDFHTISKIQEEYPKMNTLLLSSEIRLFENYLFASTHPINAFSSKMVSPETVIEIIKKVVLKRKTELIYRADIQEQFFGKAQKRESFFTRKELNILGLLGKGKSTQEAANILNNSNRTIETHRRRMIERLDCKNIIPVVIYALTNNYIQNEAWEF